MPRARSGIGSRAEECSSGKKDEGRNIQHRTLNFEEVVKRSKQGPTPNVELRTLKSALGLARRRTGKIAELPKAVRHQLSLLIEDGLPYEKIVKKVAEIAP